jgi:hypothetical protein
VLENGVFPLVSALQSGPGGGNTMRFLFVLLLSGCVGVSAESPGDFITEEPAAPGYYGGVADMGLAAVADAGGSTPTSGNDRMVEEADIYRMQGNLLFYLNTYRGLVIYDLSDAQKPIQVSRLPIHGYPIEMFFEGGRVYALVRDALDVRQQQGQLVFQRREKSQLVSIDISDAAHPKILSRFDIEGQLREGVSRKIGDVIYVVSYVASGYGWWGWWGSTTPSSQADTAWVYSYDVSNPAAVKPVDSLQLFQGGAVHQMSSDGYVDKSFNGVTISATPTTLMVSESWSNSAWSSSPGPTWCGNWDYYQSSVLSLVDVSDPAGKISIKTHFEERGALADQFKQTVIAEPNGDQTWLGIIQRQEWSGQACTSTQVVQNRLVSVDVTPGRTPLELDALAFGEPGQSVRGSVFDPGRGVAFAITARAVDPLYVLDYSDPRALTIRSQIDGLSGDMSVFSDAGRGFLLGVGRDTSATCSGFDTTRASTQMAVSVIDAQNLDAIRLVQRRCVTVDSSKWQWSQISWNQDQAHKMLGLYSDANVSLIGVPINYWQDSGDGWGDERSAVGLMRIDLGAYAPLKDPTQQTVLQDLGTISHPHGEVERTIFYQQPSGLMVATLSMTHLAVTDLSNLSAPVARSEIEVANYVSGLYRVGAHLVQIIGEPTWWGKGKSELRVVAADDSRPVEDRPIEASLTLGAVRQTLLQGSRLLLSVTKPGTDWKEQLAVVELSDPLKPVLAAQIDLPDDWYYYLPYSTYCGKESYPLRGGGYYYGNMTVSTDAGLVSLQSRYSYDNYNTQTFSLRTLDLSDLSNPQFGGVSLDAGADYVGLVASPDEPDAFYLTSRVKVGQRTDNGQVLDQFRYYAQIYRHQSGGWAAGERINLRGALDQVFLQEGSRRFLTRDASYQIDSQNGYSYWKATTRLNLLSEVPGGARLLDNVYFDSFYANGWLRDGTQLYVTGSPDWMDGSQLVLYDLGGGHFDEKLRADTNSYWVSLAGVHEGRLFLQVGWEGTLVADVRNPSAPVGLDWVPSESPVSYIAFENDRALVANGYFGVVNVDLQKSAFAP